MNDMIAEYEQNFPPAAFYEYEGRGGWDAPYESPGSAGGAALTREDVERAEAEMASALGTTVGLVHDAALEAGGINPRGNTDFVSLAAHGAALGELALSTGVTSGGYTDPADEVARIAADAPWRTYSNRSGQRVTQPLIDPAKAARALQPAPERFRDDPPEPGLTGRQEDEILRLTQVNLRRATYGAVPVTARDETRVGLAARRISDYIELAADGTTRTYTSNGATVTEYDATAEGEAITDLNEVQAEIQRYLDMRASLMGQSPLINDSGNRSYAPGPRSAWGQRTQPGASWFSGQC